MERYFCIQQAWKIYDPALNKDILVRSRNKNKYT